MSPFLFWFSLFALVQGKAVSIASQTTKRPSDDFINELQASDEICQPPITSLVNFYSGIANNIQKKDDFQRTQMSEVDWSKLLSPAPTAIAVIGNLLLITATRDVSLADNPPVSGWRHVKRPSSLRASLMQLSDEAYHALLGAHSNMDVIRLKTGNVPIYFKQISRLLAKGTTKQKEEYLPLTLSRIEDVASSCSDLANKTAQHFKNVSSLIGELLTGCLGTRQLREEELEEVEIELEATAIEVEMVEKEIDNYEKHAEEATRRIDQLFCKLQDVIRDAPGGFELLLANIFDGFKTLLNPLCLFGFGSNTERRSSSQARSIQGGEVFAEIEIFKTLVASLQANQMTPIKLVKKLRQGKNAEARNEAFYLKKKLKNDKMSIGQYSHIPQDLRNEMKSLFDSGVDIASKIANISKPSINENDGTLNALDNQCVAWAKQVGILVQRFTNSLGMKSMAEISIATRRQIEVNPSGSLASQIMDSWRHQVAAQEQLLARAQQKYEFEQRRLDEANHHAGKLLGELSRLDMRESDLEDSIRILKEAYKQLGLLQVQWRQLERFFRQVSRVMSDKWLKRMMEFSEEIRVLLEQKGVVNPFDLGTDILYRSAFRAASLSYRVHHIADRYVTVSDAHFLPPLIRMSRLLTVDPHKDRKRFEIERGDLNRNVVRAKSDIQKLIVEDRQSLKERLTIYRNNLHQKFEMLCPIDEKDEVKIRKITDESVKIGNELPPFDFFGGLS